MLQIKPMLLLAAGGSNQHGKILLTLFVMFVAAKLLAELFERLRQPAVAGEILAGVIIGPSVLNLVQPNELTNTLAEIGVILLLFLVGLETKPADIFRVGGRALLVGLLGVILPFIAGWALMKLWGRSGIEAIFVGAAMVATSVGITARVLGQMGVLNAEASRIILGAAVIDDVLGLIVLSVVSSLAGGGAVNYTEILTTTGLAIGFTVLIAVVGAKAVNKIQPQVSRLRVGQAQLVFGLSLCLGLALVASYIGVAAIIGAFMAGMAQSEAVEGTDMPPQAEAVTEFLLPFFLTNIGMQLNVQIFQSKEVVLLAIVILVVAVLTKVIGCGLGALPLGAKQALQVGVGMIPRGEVGIVIAQIGLGLAAVSNETYGVVLIMAVGTTLIAPPLLAQLFKDEPKDEHKRIYPLTPIS